MKVSKKRAKSIGETMGVDWSHTSLSEFHKGLNVELEHTDVTRGDLTLTGMIALAHLEEWPDYYTRLVEMEK